MKLSLLAAYITYQVGYEFSTFIATDCGYALWEPLQDLMFLRSQLSLG